MTVAVEPVGPEAAGDLARLHAACFSDPWSEREFASLIQSAGVAALVLRVDGEARGFVVVRKAVDEAEVLTIGVAPHARVAGSWPPDAGGRRGLGVRSRCGANFSRGLG